MADVASKKPAPSLLTAYLGLSIPESTNFGGLFIFHLINRLDLIFQTPLQHIIFPFSAVMGAAKAVVQWLTFRSTPENDKHYKKTLGLTAWEIVSAAITLVAVSVGRIAFLAGVSAATSAAIGLGISVAFTISLGVSTLIHGGFLAYHLYKYRLHKDKEPTKKEEHRKDAIHHAIVTGIVGLLTASVVLAMIAGFPVLGGAIGAATCAASVGYTIYNLVNHVKRVNAEEKAAAAKTPSSTAQMQTELGKTNAKTPTVAPTKSATNTTTTTPSNDPTLPPPQPVAANAANSTPRRRR